MDQCWYVSVHAGSRIFCGFWQMHNVLQSSFINWKIPFSTSSSLPWALATTGPFTVSTVLSLAKHPVGRSLSDQLLPLSDVNLRCLHVFVWPESSFLSGWITSHCLEHHGLFVRSPLKGTRTAQQTLHAEAAKPGYIMDFSETEALMPLDFCEPKFSKVQANQKLKGANTYEIAFSSVDNKYLVGLLIRSMSRSNKH